MQNSEKIWQLVDARKDAYEALSDRVWEMPEIAYTEYRSVAEHRAMLEQEGFRITENLAGIPTAVMGESGDGGPVIAILGEYDALPGLSQVAGIAEPKEVVAGGHGHGCGHNMLGSAALLAATAVKNYLAAAGIKGRVRYYGCPAEEGGAAKAFMVRAGHFEDVDIAITWHPAAITRVDDAMSLANTRIDFAFKGRASHAAASPHLGRSALDAVELMNVGVNYMREHMPSDARIHYAILDAGGVAPNVVQGSAKVRYAIRARDLPGMRPLIERVRKVAAGAAMMTETQVETKVVSAVSNLLGNTPLEEAMQRQLERLGPPPFDAADRKYAADDPGDADAGGHRLGLRPRRRAREEGPAAVRLRRALRHQGRADDRLDRRGRRQLGGADGAGPRRHARHRHAGPFLADHGAGQVRPGQEGHGQRRQGDGGAGGRCAERSRADRPRQGRSQGAHRGDALRLPVACRRAAADPAATGRCVRRGAGKGRCAGLVQCKPSTTRDSPSSAHAPIGRDKHHRQPYSWQ